jgi:hypothetical protein
MCRKISSIPSAPVRMRPLGKFLHDYFTEAQ